MIDLFRKYKDAGQLVNALLVGRNLLNRDPGNREAFAPYFDFLCSLAEGLPALADRQNFAQQASVVLSFYEENTKLTEDSVAEIGAWQERLNEVISAIDSEQAEILHQHQEEIAKQNDDCLKKLFALKDEICQASTQQDFDAAMAKIGALDQKIDQDTLTEDQTRMYERLTKEHTDLIGEKMAQLEHKKNVSYNKQAVEAYQRAFQTFKANESKYKDHTQLYSLAAGTLFAYDAARLFNETLIYYNHVYSYIFSKLDDNGKFALTRYSIECERKLR